MHAQLITYELSGINREDVLAQFVEPFTTHFAELPSLISKVWLDDQEGGNYGGFYLWADKAAMDEFMASDAAKDIISRPYIAGLSVRDWPINEVATEANRGLAAAGATR